MNKTTKPKAPATVTAFTVGMMRSKGLTRDKANYVMAVVRMRAEVRHLMRTATDDTVVQELLCLDEFFEDTVTTIYAEQSNKPQPTKPKGAA